MWPDKFYSVEMAKRDYLGAFEQLVLFALIRLGNDAYGMKIRREIVSRTDRDVAIGAVYATLDRLEEKGLVSSNDGSEGTGDRDGNGRRFFRIEAPGIAAVNESWKAIKAMTSGLKPLRGDA
jgi:PadR family transcriptional regulator PadR